MCPSVPVNVMGEYHTLTVLAREVRRKEGVHGDCRGLAPNSYLQTPRGPLGRLLRIPQIWNTHVVGYGKVWAAL